MMDVLIWIGIFVVFTTGLCGPWLLWRKDNQGALAKQAGWAAEHEAQTAELTRQRRLRELEEHRRGLLRGRERPCRFCGVEDGCLTPDDVCMEVESCLTRGGVPTSAVQG